MNFPNPESVKRCEALCNADVQVSQSCTFLLKAMKRNVYLQLSANVSAYLISSSTIKVWMPWTSVSSVAKTVKTPRATRLVYLFILEKNYTFHLALYLFGSRQIVALSPKSSMWFIFKMYDTYMGLVLTVEVCRYFTATPVSFPGGPFSVILQVFLVSTLQTKETSLCRSEFVETELVWKKIRTFVIFDVADLKMAFLITFFMLSMRTEDSIGYAWTLETSDKWAYQTQHTFSGWLRWWFYRKSICGEAPSIWSVVTRQLYPAESIIAFAAICSASRFLKRRVSFLIIDHARRSKM